MDYVLLTILALLVLFGVVLAVFQLPGTWVIFASAIGYDWYQHWARLGWKALVALGVLAILAEVFETMTGAMMARRAGASRRAAVCALLGGFAGMIEFTVPIPVIGTILGGLLDCFLGAFLAKLTVRDDVMAGTRIGAAAALGRLAGMLIKTAAAFAMAGLTLGLAAYDLIKRG